MSHGILPLLKIFVVVSNSQVMWLVRLAGFWHFSFLLCGGSIHQLCLRCLDKPLAQWLNVFKFTMWTTAVGCAHTYLVDYANVFTLRQHCGHKGHRDSKSTLWIVRPYALWKVRDRVYAGAVRHFWLWALCYSHCDWNRDQWAWPVHQKHATEPLESVCYERAFGYLPEE